MMMARDAPAGPVSEVHEIKDAPDTAGCRAVISSAITGISSGHREGSAPTDMSSSTRCSTPASLPGLACISSVGMALDLSALA
jgi:hypothetical protein